MKEEICMLPIIPAALLNGSCYYNNVHISVSHSGDGSDFVADKFKMKEYYYAAEAFPTSFLVMMLLLGTCQRSHLI